MVQEMVDVPIVFIGLTTSTSTNASHEWHQLLPEDIILKLGGDPELPESQGLIFEELREPVETGV